MVKRWPGKSGGIVVVAVFDECFALSACRLFENLLNILEKSRFRWTFHVFGPSRSPRCFFGCLLGHPCAVCFRLMFHTLGLLGQFVLHAICIRNTRCTNWFRIQYYIFVTFCSVRGLTLCLFFTVASNEEVSFSITVSRFRRVEHGMRRFTFFSKFLKKICCNSSASAAIWRPYGVHVVIFGHPLAPVGCPLGRLGCPLAVDLVTIANFFHFQIRPNPPKLSQTAVFDYS